jgi:hypothetical protein
MISGQHTHK